MSTASMYGNQIISVELDCPWMTIDADIEFIHYGDGENLIEIVSVKSHGVDITNWINNNYIYDLISDELTNADYHWTDHGDIA